MIDILMIVLPNNTNFLSTLTEIYVVLNIILKYNLEEGFKINMYFLHIYLP